MSGNQDCEGGATDNPNTSDVARSDLERIERAARRLAETREELRVAMELARAAGETLEDIGRAAGISRQAVSQALRRRR